MQLYDSADEVGMRLRGTVVLYKGSPVYITDVLPFNSRDEPEVTIYYQVLPYNRRTALVQVPFHEFQKQGNAQTYNIGYFNYKHPDLEYHSVGFLTRLPSRRTRQGLSSDNTQITLSPEYQALLGRQSINNVINIEGFRDMFLNTYPTGEDVLQILKGDVHPNTAYAISKDFALSVDDLEQFILYYKGNKVALCSGGKTPTFKLPKKQHWLREKMAYHGLNVA